MKKNDFDTEGINEPRRKPRKAPIQEPATAASELPTPATPDLIAPGIARDDGDDDFTRYCWGHVAELEVIRESERKSYQERYPAMYSWNYDAPQGWPECPTSGCWRNLATERRRINNHRIALMRRFTTVH